MTALHQLLRQRYYHPGERSWLALSLRVAAFLYPDDEYMQNQTRALIEGKVFLPSSPVLMNAGSALPMLSSCFVLPVGDSIDSIMQALTDTMRIQKYGGGVGLNFSAIRPEGSEVKTTRGRASGPVSFMGFWNEGMNVIRQGGKRQGAMMGVLNASHPDLDLFLCAKEDEGQLTNFNLSVALPYEFFDALTGRNKRTAHILDQIARRAWSNGEPGILFLDNINKTMPYESYITATNPCGELPLPPYGACCLGSINLAQCMYWAATGGLAFRWGYLTDIAILATRILNRVLDKSWWPLPEIEAFEKEWRPIGLGVMGLAETLATLGLAYDSKDGRDFAKKVMTTISEAALWAATGNATQTAIAPTGTLAMLAGTTYSIEPYFAHKYTKTVEAGAFEVVTPIVRQLTKQHGYTLTDEDLDAIDQTGSVQQTGLPAGLKRVLKTANEIRPFDHLLMQATIQQEVDSAVSKTINMPETTTVDEVRELILNAHVLGIKGLTLYRNRSREEEVISCPTGTCDL